jgi:hypothetical protein
LRATTSATAAFHFAGIAISHKVNQRSVVFAENGCQITGQLAVVF